MALFKKKEAAPSKPIKLCKGCGAAMAVDALQCKNCGAREKICQGCKKTIPIQQNRCMYCGALNL